MARENLRGRQFRDWLVLDREPFYKEYGKTRDRARWCWRCLCLRCGKEFDVQHYDLLYKKSQACRVCATALANKTRFNRFRAFPNQEDVGLNGFYNRYIRGARSRGLSFDLEPEVFRALVTGECFYCGFVGKTYVYNAQHKKNSHKFFGNGIDRVNNGLGYTEDNCVTCCEKCNNKKMGVPDYILDKIIARKNGAYQGFISSEVMLWLF